MYPSPDLHCAKLQQRPAEESARPISADNLPEKLSLPPPPSILRLRFFQIFLLLIRSFRSSSFAKGPFFFVPRGSFFVVSHSIFPLLLLPRFRRLPLPGNELFESIAVTNVAVINWNRLRNCERGVREGARRGERIEKGDDRARERERSAHR